MLNNTKLHKLYIPMQIIDHKKTTLTICQKFFIEKSIELLYYGSMDSYRVRLNNPKTVLQELKYCLKEFEIGRVKHFQTIKSKEKEKKALVNETLVLINLEPNFIDFSSISKNYLEQLLNKIDENNYKKVISSVDILLNENGDYLSKVINGLKYIIDGNDSSLLGLENLDKTLNILFSELISKGFSKGFLYKIIYGIFVNTLKSTSDFNSHFENFKIRVTDEEYEHIVIFRMDTTLKVYDSISTITNNLFILSDEIDDVRLTGEKVNRELDSFKLKVNNRKFISFKANALDYLAALKKARNVLSEYLDVVNLGLSDEFLHVHNRALVIDVRSPKKGNFQNNINILDGKYKVEKEHYIQFSQKLPILISNSKVANETKEKIKSAIRYLRLGNQSTEVEHKFINYWIGLEYLFSNYESQSTINRIKDHFINAHSLAYLFRNLHSFKKSFLQLSSSNIILITSYNVSDDSFLQDEHFYNEIGSTLINDFPLLSYRALKLKKWLFQNNKPSNATDYINHHKDNLEIHFTRIYRLRNEIIHDAATDTNNEQIASNLRYYLTFILNEVIDFLAKPTNKELSIEEYFILNEIKLGNISQQGYLIKDLLSVDCSIDFIS